MLAGIREILLISTPQDLPLFQRLFEDGSQLGLKLTYAAQPRPEGLAQAFHIGADFVAGHPSALVLGDNLFYGHDFARSLQAACARTTGATVFGYHVADPEAYGVVEFSPDGRVLAAHEGVRNGREPQGSQQDHDGDDCEAEASFGKEPRRKDHRALAQLVSQEQQGQHRGHRKERRRTALPDV